MQDMVPLTALDEDSLNFLFSLSLYIVKTLLHTLCQPQHTMKKTERNKDDSSDTLI